MKVSTLETPAVIYLPPPRPERRKGRRPATDPRSALIWLRTTAAQKASITDAAERAGLSLTGYLLGHLPGAAAQRGRAVATGLDRESKQLLVSALAGLGKLGSNHNQLARRKNQTGEEPGIEEWRRIDAAIQEIRAALLAALGRPVRQA